MKKLFLMLLAAGMLGFASTSCDSRQENKTEEVADDIEDAGDEIEDEAEEVKDEVKR